jgi:peptidoglycan/LPS O-acetylase OafA/YrhL
MTVASMSAAPVALAQPYRPIGTFRLFLAGLVLVSHSSAMLPPFVAPLSLGNVGVLMFFAVSGFVIAEALDLFYRDRPLRFLANRFLKIYPAYWAALPLAAIGLAVSGRSIELGPFPLVVNAALLAGYLPGAGEVLWLSIAWAIIVEFQFYFAAAAVAAIGALTGKRGASTGLALAGALAMYAVVWLTEGYARFYGAFQFAPFFVAGVAAYLHLSRGSPLATLLLALSAALSLHAYAAYVGRGPSALEASMAIFAVVAVLFFALARGECSYAMKHVDHFLGDLSYPVYLLHMPVVAAAERWSLGFPFAISVTLLLSLAVHFAVEHPVKAIRQRVRGRTL